MKNEYKNPYSKLGGWQKAYDVLRIAWQNNEVENIERAIDFVLAIAERHGANPKPDEYYRAEAEKLFAEKVWESK
jgi:hypothetical protein